jgi:hypothetical protein
LYAAYPFADEARLILNNSTRHQVTIEGKLYSSSGRAAILEDIVLPPHQQMAFDLGQKIAQEGPEFKTGGLELEFQSADPGIAGQLILRNHLSQQSIDIPLKSAANLRSSKLEGLWWLPARDSQIGLVIYNPSTTQTSGLVTISRGDGTVVRSIPVVLGPHHSVALDLHELHREAVGEAGGISIQHNGARGGWIAAGYLWVPSAQFSTSLSFVNPETLYGSNIYGAGIQLGTTPLAEERFSGKLIVRNLANQAVPVTPSLQCGETRTALSDFVLQAGQSRRIEVPANAITCESGAAGIEVASPVKGSLLGRWLSVGKSSGLVVETAMHSVSPRANLSGSDPWWIDAETASILYVQNVGNQEAGVVPVIHYTQHGEHGGPMAHSDERYVVGLKRVRPGETVAIDIRALRDNQTPDVEGRVLPRDLRFGQIHWLRRHGPALVANVLTVGAAKRTASTFSFFCCYCSPRSATVSLNPASVSAQVGDEQDETLWETIVDCHDMPTSYPVPASEASWSSSNYSVASVDSLGRVYCGYPGTATVTATKLVELLSPDYSIGPGDSCYLDDSCYGEPVCQSALEYRYAAAYFDVSPPPACAIPTNFRTNSVTHQTDGGLRFVYEWSSTTGNNNDLSQCRTGETVFYPGYPTTPYIWPLPMEQETVNPTQVWAFGNNATMIDVNAPPSGYRLPYSASSFEATHRLWWSCPCHNNGAVQYFVPDIIIRRRIFKDSENKWKYEIQKSDETNTRVLPNQ